MPTEQITAESIAARKSDLLKAIAHPSRIRILEILADGPRTVGALQPDVGIESSHLSQQLAVLRRGGLVTFRKDGSTVTYAIKDPALTELLTVARRLLVNSLTETRDLLSDLEETR